MKCIVLIPARYESSRFPGKPLAKICGEEMIIRVCRQVAKTGIPLAVATDNDLIASRVREKGFEAVMTSSAHRSGTERIEEAYRNLNSDAEVVINVQGDEPFIDPAQILALKEIFDTYDDTKIATLARPFDPSAGYEALDNPNLVKLVKSDEDKALYFSRSVIPYIRNVEKEDWPVNHQYFSHIGIYAYRADVLKRIVALPETSLEKAESLEQLRWLQHGISVRVGVSDVQTIGIDTPADLEEAEAYLRAQGKA
ncbi:MAG: 3-deoxy-manno-octulosonate cytidylyltransferase [Muribaculaceae bacterium]|nr:3-deoxy-manno-octulosonate cytidylyltransferase [Muribaculaceae bacterium]